MVKKIWRKETSSVTSLGESTHMDARAPLWHFIEFIMSYMAALSHLEEKTLT